MRLFLTMCSCRLLVTSDAAGSSTGGSTAVRHRKALARRWGRRPRSCARPRRDEGAVLAAGQAAAADDSDEVLDLRGVVAAAAWEWEEGSDVEVEAAWDVAWAVRPLNTVRQDSMDLDEVHGWVSF